MPDSTASKIRSPQMPSDYPHAQRFSRGARALATLVLASVCATGVAAPKAMAQDVSEGERLSVLGGCHDCHTAGYTRSGEIDPVAALKGNPVGYQGPWGTTYAKNLRRTAAGMSESEWVDYMHSVRTRPPMPWFNLHAFKTEEAAAIYRYIRSLGDPGKAMPEALPPGETPTTPVVVMVPQPPQG